MSDISIYQNIKILVVEDDLPSRIYIAKSLQKVVQTIEEATNGKEGLEKFENGEFDIVISDIGMPLMNGLQMSKIIKEKSPKVQIILATAFDNKEFLLEAIKMGINDFLSKPVDRDMLFSAVEKAIHFINLEKEVEEAHNLIIKQNEILEEKVQNRTQELKSSNIKLLQEIEVRKKIESELILAKEQAEKASNAKSAFLAKVSHELRTPLNGILGISSILNKSIKDTRQLEFINMIKISGEGLLRLINDILDYTKIETGKLVLRNTDFDLRVLIKEVIELNQFASYEKGIKFVYFINDKIPETIYSDPGRLKQILMNLVGNAIKFTEKGEIVLITDIKKSENENLELIFSVKDSGIGIPKSSWNILFNSFSQVDNSLTRKHGGTGLGLSISKDLVELLNGKIWFDSVENHGTTFFFTISVKGKELSQSIIVNNKNIQISDESINKLKEYPIKILVADDSRINLSVFTSMFDFELWRVVTVTNGREAIELAKSGNYDIAILDVNMPIVDGLESSKIINSFFSDNNKNLPIIGLTGDVSDSSKLMIYDSGMVDVIEKPINKKLIVEKIEKYIQYRIPIFETQGYFNLENLKTITKKNPKVLSDIIDYIINNSKNELKILQDLIDLQSFEDLRKFSHRMKSEFNNIDALKIIRYLDLIENNSKNKNITQIKFILPLITVELEKLIENLINYKINMELK